MNQERLNQRFREAVLNGSLILAENLFRQGANPDCVYSDGRTLLCILAERNDLDKIKFLVETCHADPRVRDRDGKLASEFASSSDVSDYIGLKINERDLLIFKFTEDVIDGRFEAAREKVKNGVNPNEGYGNGNLDFVLLDACNQGKLSAIRVLVEELGANPHLKSTDGKTILELVREAATSSTATDQEIRILKCLEDAIWRKEHPILARWKRKPTGDEVYSVAPSSGPVAHSGQTQVSTIVVGPTPSLAPQRRILTHVLGAVGVAAAGIGLVFVLRSGNDTTPLEHAQQKFDVSSSAVSPATTSDTPVPVKPVVKPEAQKPAPKPVVAVPAPEPKEPPKPQVQKPVVDPDAASVARKMQQRLTCREQERRAAESCRRANSPFCVMPRCTLRGK